MWPFKSKVQKEMDKLDPEKRKHKRLYKLILVEAVLIAILLAYIYFAQFRAAT